jgi:purine-binding chemotaxis protein CheW
MGINMEQVKAITTEQETETAVQYIVVRIGNEQYGINIKYIDNIVRNQKITRVPKTQTYYKGVINLRGEIIPVMSIRLKLGLEDDEFTDKTRIIIVKIEGATIGVIVDQVREVVTLDDDNTEKITRTSRDDAASGYISSIGKSKGELISLLDIVGLIVEN